MPLLIRTLLFALVLSGCDTSAPPDRENRAAPGTMPPTTYVGSEHCVSCHRQEFQSWQGSHHDLAMKEASEATVLGDFGNAEFSYNGIRSRFFRQDGKFLVQTDGPDGDLQDYPIAYTFGVYPLQQYLLELPGGRLQALSIAWDSRGKEDGGQRWFHLYPNEQIASGDELHWTGLNQNWNFMCADCHSTNLQKNYDLASQTYTTRWSEINVACEACHGPGSRHLQWAQNPNADIVDKGLAVSYSGRKSAAWRMNTASGIAQLADPADSQRELATCAQCHSRRTTAFPGAQAGAPFMDHFNLSLLEEGLYHADGQIDGEVYVYGSFLQSRMHAAGVTCSNCHDPHSLQLRAPGNAVCAQCHLPEKFDSADHHFHPADSAGAQCVSCHMPARTYMQVDARRDHSFRIPRPELSEKLQTPNACTDCHRNKPDSWAAQVLKERFGRPTGMHYGEAIYAGRHGLPGAEAKLIELIGDESQADIARATAVSLLPRYLSMQSAQLLQAIAQGDNPLLQLGLAQSLQALPPQIRPAAAIPLLYEDERVIAALAANALSDLPVDGYPPEVQQRFARALNHYLVSESFNADRPESLANLGGLHAQRGNAQQAEAFYRRAMKVAPYYTPAYINLADLYRALGEEDKAEALLREALNHVRDKTPVQHALGLALVRQQRSSEALNYLREAAHSETATARYIYVYAIALNSSGKPDTALAELERGRQRFPAHRDILAALASINRERGNRQAADRYEQMLR